MKHLGTLRDAVARRTSYRLDGELLSHKSVIIGADHPDDSMPNAFLVEQQAHRDLPPHFHGYGQFQVVVGGTGRLGGHDLRPLSVHYAGQRTTYGPIQPGPDGLSYLTLRPRTEGAAFFMPRSRHLRDAAIPRYEAFSEHHAVAGTAGNVECLETSTITMLAPTARGLAAWLIRIPGGGTASAPTLGGGGGRFHVVVGGTLPMPDEPVGWLGILWTDPLDPPVQFSATNGSAEVLVLQFPDDACKHALPASDWMATPADLDLAVYPNA